MKKAKPLLMDLEETLFLKEGSLVIIDRRRLPREVVPLRCGNVEEVARAIEEMAVQGAGDIAVAAGFGLYLAVRSPAKRDREGDRAALEHAALRLRSTRPTGFHLALLLRKVLEKVAADPRPAPEVILEYLEGVVARSRAVSEATGRHGETLLAPGDTILTHCFPGPALLHMLKYATEKGKNVRVMCTETRPYLQGARLTAWSVSEMGLDTTLITDNMAAHFMSRGEVDKVFTAADRIAMDGSVANKIGTLQLALCARRFAIPFYVLGYGGPDGNTLTGKDIPIEERDPREVLEFRGHLLSGPKVKARYPAFDVTPPDLVTAVVTKDGVNFRGEDRLRVES